VIDEDVGAFVFDVDVLNDVGIQFDKEQLEMDAAGVD